MIFKAGTTSAVRWWKNGDHPDDNVVLVTTQTDDAVIREPSEGEFVSHYEVPEDIPADALHVLCSSPWSIHGWIESEGLLVCPGNWIVTRDGIPLVVEQSISGHENNEDVGGPYTRVWECMQEPGQHIITDPDAGMLAAATHASVHNHVITVYGVLDGAAE